MRVHYLLIELTCVFSSLNNVLILLCIIFLTVLTNCRIAHILGILLMNSCNTDIFFDNYYHLQSVRFEYELIKHVKRESCLRHFDGRIYVVRTISLLTPELAYSISILITAMLLTRCAKIDSLIQYY